MRRTYAHCHASERLVAEGPEEIEAFMREFLAYWRDFRIVGEDYRAIGGDKGAELTLLTLSALPGP